MVTAIPFLTFVRLKDHLRVRVGRCILGLDCRESLLCNTLRLSHLILRNIYSRKGLTRNRVSERTSLKVKELYVCLGDERIEHPRHNLVSIGAVKDDVHPRMSALEALYGQ